ncbi:hypothetical protein ACFO5X_03985 [Seohaeicola nanhaiensis]|uniref:DUF423 domain-containing protein n=1 Tax=Seohaeicola nanhaiensis TaxID=1387282 RepID=A0ABV9KCA2_9RHOB
MRNAALVLGIIAGVFGMIVGFFGYGYTVAAENFADFTSQVDNVQAMRLASVLSPMLAIAGGAMARSRALWGGILMLASAAGMYAGFGFTFYTVFPIAFAGLGGLLAIAAGKPDEEKAHF